MKRNLLIISLAFVLILSGCAKAPEVPPQEEEPPSEQSESTAGSADMPSLEEKEWSEEQSEAIASLCLQNSPTFVSRGIGDSLKLLTTTPLNEPFSWQFDYEFQCQYPGYGRLGSEPTPPDITPHRAQIVVQEGKAIYAMIDDEWDILSASQTSYEPPATLPDGNLVRVHFVREHRYIITEDTFTNQPMTNQKGWRALQPINEPDETGEPVAGLRLALESDMDLEVENDKLTKMGPPTYTWSLGNLVEEPEREGWSWDAFAIAQSSIETAPGFDASRSYDRTEFSAAGTQEMTVTVTPRDEKIDSINIFVHTDEDAYADAEVVSYSYIPGSEVSITEEGHRSGIQNIPVQVNTPIVVTVTLRITPKASCVVYKPYTAISTRYSGSVESDVTTGNSVSFTDEVGTWTWTADGDYVWHWFSPRTTDVEVQWLLSSESCAS